MSIIEELWDNAPPAPRPEPRIEYNHVQYLSEPDSEAYFARVGNPVSNSDAVITPIGLGLLDAEPPTDPLRSDAPSFFPPTGNPVRNSDSAQIYHAAEKPISNTESAFFPNAQPVSNDRDSVIHVFGAPSQQTADSLSSIGSRDVTFSPAPAPVSNDSERTILGNGQLAHTKDTFAPANNERQDFIPAPQPMSYDGLAFVALHAPASPFQTHPAPSQGTVNVGGTDVQFLPGSAIRGALNVTGDTTLGGGGDMTKLPRADEIAYLGQNMQHMSSAETYLAPSGNVTKIAGADDVTMAPNADNIGNQESTTGAIGDPAFGRDAKEIGFGGKGRPKNVKG